MNWYRVQAMTYRYLLQFKHSLARLIDSFYWPAIDLFVWGLTSLYILTLSHKNDSVIQVLLSGVLFWTVIWRSQYEVSVNLLAEFWDKTLISVFSSPLKLQEWIASFFLMGIIKLVVSFGFASLLAFLLYGFNVYSFGWALFPTVISLMIFGWTMGFFVSGILLRFGVRIEELAWAGIALVSPFAALYYPLAVLPKWAQTLAYFVPASHVLEAMRHKILQGTVDWNNLLLSFAFDIVYLLLSILFFVTMFKKSKELGFGRLI